MKLIYAAAVLTAFGLSGCGKNYEEIERGQFEGRLLVEWYKPDVFIYRPFPNDPLVFTRFDDSVFEPETFQTDGGSTPRILRSFKHYSPWGYAKAYIIHDWIFSEHYCGRMEETSFEESADILSEAIKTMILDRNAGDPSEEKVLQSIDAAVRSGFAREAWNTGECIPVEDAGFASARSQKPDAVFLVE